MVIDSFCIGDEDNEDLRTVSYMSGGYKFTPATLEEAMAICEMEPVLNQLERPPIKQVPVRRSSFFDFRRAKRYAGAEIVTRDQYPQRKQHSNLTDSFVEVSNFARTTTAFTEASSPSTVTAEFLATSSTRSARLLLEIKNIALNAHPHYDVYVSESNMGFWKIVMQGPPDSYYSKGIFVLYLDMEDNYPAFPPKGRFCTPMYHPNINRHGRICHSILDRNWTTDTSNLQVLNVIYSLFMVPEFSDPVNTIVTFNFHWDEVAFSEDVKAHIMTHATKPRETWRREILRE